MKKGKIKIDSQFCKSCQFCVENCPKNAIVLSEKLNAKGYVVAEFLIDKNCTGCATCALVCPEAAIEVWCD
jgi:2-oxoglutarate ferredoxin oxidoreductase subunit delta